MHFELCALVMMQWGTSDGLMHANKQQRSILMLSENSKSVNAVRNCMRQIIFYFDVPREDTTQVNFYLLSAKD